MRFTCPRCSAKYRLDESKIKVSVLKFQCRKCSATLNIKIPKEPKKDKVKAPVTTPAVPVPPKMSQAAPALKDKAPKEAEAKAPAEISSDEKKNNLIGETESSLPSKSLTIQTKTSIAEDQGPGATKEESEEPRKELSEDLDKEPGKDLENKSEDSFEPVPEVKRIPVATYNEDGLSGEIEMGTQTFIIEAGLGEAHNRRKTLMLFGMGIGALLLAFVAINFFIGQAPKVKTIVTDTSNKYQKKKKPKKKFVFTEEEKKMFAQMGKTYENQLAEEEAKKPKKEEYVFEQDEDEPTVKGSEKIRSKVKLSDTQKKSLEALYSGDQAKVASALDIKGPDLPVFPKKAVQGPARSGSSMEDLKQKERRDIRRALDKQLRGLEFCYEMALKTNRKLRGRVLMDLSITKSGKVSKLSVDMGKMNDPRFKSCLLARIKQWKFSGISKEELSLSIPYNFEPRY